MTWDKREGEVFGEGRKAFLKKKNPSFNPYNKGTSSHREWFRGFRYQKHQSSKTAKKYFNPLGKEAFLSGNPVSSNPFEKDSQAYRNWNYAWRITAFQYAKAEGYRDGSEYSFSNPYLGKDNYLEEAWNSGHRLSQFHLERYSETYDIYSIPEYERESK